LIDTIVENTLRDLKICEADDILCIEDIQNSVEKNLMEAGKFEVAKAYIIYRNARSKEREKQKEKLEKKLATHSLKVTKTD
jgi:ribonucleoside-diphosphate reductase alpha chain